MPTLVRALGRWSFTAILLNIVIGASAFGLPGDIAALLGPNAPWAYAIGGLGILMIGACFAEVASYFDQAGGPYLYAREAYGRFAGIYIAYLMTFVRISAAAAVANLFATYLAQFFPALEAGTPRAVALTVLLVTITGINYLGVQLGAGVSNAFAVLKVGSLAAFGIGGLAFVLWHREFSAAPAANVITAKSWLEAFVLTVFAYGGFEAGLVPASEAKDARKDAPIAVFATLGIAALLYTLVQVGVTFALPGAATSKRAVADASAVIFGAAGPQIMAIAAVIAICGYLLASILAGSRVLFALSEQRDTIAAFGKVHPRFHTPHVALLIFAAITWALTIFGTFSWAARVSAVTRLLVYASVCGAVFVFRRRNRAGLRLRYAPLAAFAGIGFCALLVTRMGAKEMLVMAVVGLLAGLSQLAAGKAAETHPSHTA